MIGVLSKKTVLPLVIFLLVLLGVGAWLGVMLSSEQDGSVISKYSAVTMTSGDVFFGELSWFPSPKIKNAWVLQRGVDDKDQVQVWVSKVSDGALGPSSDIYLNSNEILSWTYLRQDSQVVKDMEHPGPAQGLPSPSR